MNVVVAASLLLATACRTDKPPSSEKPTVVKSPPEMGIVDDLVSIPAGDFIGRSLHCKETDISSVPSRETEERLRSVKQTTTGYAIDRTETSCVHYGKCIAAGGCSRNQLALCYDDHAVVELADAAQYCAWRGMRVVTLAEWQRAIRSTDGRPFPNGEESFALSSVCPDSKKPCRVVSPDGVHYTIGPDNEWTSDTDCTEDRNEPGRVIRAPVQISRSTGALVSVMVAAPAGSATFRCAR